MSFLPPDGALFVSPDWLAERLDRPDIRLVDASWFLPGTGRDGRAEYETTHIPGAVYFDLDGIADPLTDLPHMLPAPHQFGESAGAMGIKETDIIIVYDSDGLFSAPRVWWTFRIMGATNVRLLEGGLPAWKAAGHPLTNEVTAPAPAQFVASPTPGAVASFSDILRACETGDSLILDARPAGRFSGRDPEPRPGLSSGHIPGSLSLPASDLIHEGRLLPPEVLAARFAQLGLTPGQPVITTCGSGVTAAILALALTAIGHDTCRLYDGSWAEWASHPDAIIETDTN